jgi:hypothetical protein
VRPACWLSLFLATTPLSAQSRFDFGRDVGILTRDAASRPCIALSGAGLAPGARLTLILPASSRGTDSTVMAAALITAPADSTCDALDRKASAWRIRPVGDTSGFAPLGIALLDRGISWRRTGRDLAADLDGDGIPEYFRACASLEGIHLTIWSGAPLTGRRRWHHYRYLGYDLEPDCTAGETGDGA